MGKDELNDLVIGSTAGSSIAWVPEDYGFEPNEFRTIFYCNGKKDFELRPLKGDFWLMRRKITNKRGNVEYLVKWYLKIDSSDKEFADLVFSKGLE